MTTLLVTPGELDGAELVVAGDRHRHLFRARRLGPGEALRVVDGHGRARRATVTGVERRRALLRLGGPAPAREPALDLSLLVAAPRPERAAWLVEKATELGVVAIRFLNTARAPRRYGAATLARLARRAAAAVEQCERSRLPEVTGPHAWPELEALLAASAARWTLEPRAPAPPPAATPSPAALLVGPEGGWTGDELEALETLSCHPFTLGPTTLRTETAALAGAAVLLAAPG